MKQQKTRRAKTLFTLVALVVVLMSNVFVGRAEEPDPRILWVADIGLFDGFALHPNGNVFAYQNYHSPGGVWSFHLFEIDGKTGKVIKKYPIITDYLKTQSVEQLDISDDGQYLALRGGYLYEFQTEKIYKFGGAGYVKFIPNTNILAYASWDDNEGRNPSIVMLNIETKEKKTIYTEEDIHRIAFSPDGKYMATGGTKITSGGDYYTVFKLWDAQKLTLIQELKRYDDRYNSQPKIKFSPDSKTLCINPGDGLMFFELNNYSFTKNIYKAGHYEFINDSLMVYNNVNVNIKILNYIDFTEVAVIGNYNPYMNLLYSSSNKSIIFNYLDKTNPTETSQKLVCFDFDKVMSVSDNPIVIDSLMIKYENGNISIMNIPNIYSNYNLNIADIGGKIVFEQSINNLNNNSLNIQLNLSQGIYFLNLSNNRNSKTYKFLVTK